MKIRVLLSFACILAGFAAQAGQKGRSPEPSAVSAAAIAIHSATNEREPLEVYQQRRKDLEGKLSDGLIILFGATDASGSEAYHVFRQESNFYYLTGYTDPGAVLLIAPPIQDRRSPSWEQSSSLPREILLLPQRNPDEERWTGPQLDPYNPSTAEQLGFSKVEGTEQLAGEIRRYAEGYATVYTLFADPHVGEEESPEKQNLEKLRTLLPFMSFRDARRAIGALRQVKSQTELDLIQRAIDCTISGLESSERGVRPDIFEYQISALLKYTFEREGCRGLAFDPIVGSGFNSTVLHYTKNFAQMHSGDLVVMDVGAEYGHYAADITRTIPVNGRFTARQREIYNIVLGAQKAALAAVKPGMRITGRGSDSLYQIALDYINSHGQDSHGEKLGKYFIHGLSHHVGLDVHDAGDPARVLEPGMVITIEPGIYLPEENLGVRIEDMVLVTNSGYELLTRRLPREASEIENWIKVAPSNRPPM